MFSFEFISYLLTSYYMKIFLERIAKDAMINELQLLLSSSPHNMRKNMA